jgi:cephalosporin hydroxylase
MNPIQEFLNEVAINIQNQGKDQTLQDLSIEWMQSIAKHRYTHNFSHLGRPIIQFPQDMVAMQELIWKVRPDLIIETGIAHGGSVILSASMLALLDICDAIQEKKILDPAKSNRKVLGIDIDIRAHNRAAIEAHPMASRIQMIQGSSIDTNIVQQIKYIAAMHRTILVCLDSIHTHEHVLKELQAYAPLVTKGSYCVVFDTIVEDLPKEMFPDRPWGPGNNPKTAVWEFLKTHPEFETDKAMDNKLLISVAPSGFLKRVL